MNELKEKDIDIILYLDKEKEARQFIENIRKRNDCNLIVIDILCNNKTKKIKTNYENGNTIFIENKNATKSIAYNEGLKYSKSKYVTFVIPNMDYEEKAIDTVIEHIKKDKYPIISLTPYHNEEKYIGFRKNDVNDGTVINLDTHTQNFILYIYGYFFKRELLKDFSFDEDLTCDGTIKFILDVLLKERKYLLSKKGYNYNEPIEDEYFNFEHQFIKDWYLNDMSKFVCSYVKPDSPLFIKYAITYIIQCRYACNLDTRNKDVLNPEETDVFFGYTSIALKNIDDYIISHNRISGRKTLPKYVTLNLIRLKYQDEKIYPKKVSTGLNVTAYVNDAIIEKISSEKLEMRVIYFDGKNLTMDGIYRGSYIFEDGEMEIVARINEEEYIVRKNEVYALNKVFNMPTRKSYTFQFSIPSKKLSEGTKISFWLKYKGDSYPLNVMFKRAQSKLSSKFNMVYWRFDGKILTYRHKHKYFNVWKATKKRVLKKEIKLIWQFIKKGDKDIKWKNIRLRILYWVTKPFFKKKIWITSDKIFKAGDNGEYMYRYIKKVNPKDIKIYYIVSKDSPDYKRLKKQYNTILKFNSLKQKIVALHCDMFLATHVDVLNCCGFDSDNQQYIKDLFNPKIACIAHGLTIQKIAQYQNRVFDNTTLYFFASKYEIENVKHPIYDYYDESVLKLTGHARYDGLKNNDKKQILITPTWRRGITVGNATKGSSYGHSDTFKLSEYYKIYNRLINDKQLIENAKKNGYEIIYLLHPAMSAQINDFDRNDYVKIIAATSDVSYEKILTESSLMVTDYSGVQFDFAYMKKPLVYYHPSSLPAQYAEGGLKYDTMGFGPICKEHDEIITELCNYMDNGCEMLEEYKSRVDDFFEYNDYDNCKRIYDELIKYKDSK